MLKFFKIDNHAKSKKEWGTQNTMRDSGLMTVIRRGQVGPLSRVYHLESFFERGPEWNAFSESRFLDAHCRECFLAKLFI